jgi:hypothetical protein
METVATDPAAQKRRVNDMMREGLRAHDPNEPIPFFCECESKDCYEAFWRTGLQYDEARRDASWRALAGHARSPIAPQQQSGALIGVYEATSPAARTVSGNEPRRSDSPDW